MSRQAITAVTVTYQDGTTQTWEGAGAVELNRTPTEAGGAPILRDSDISYVQVVLPFKRTEAAS